MDREYAIEALWVFIEKSIEEFSPAKDAASRNYARAREYFNAIGVSDSELLKAICS